MAEMIAYCGLVCSECDAYKATASGDKAELGRVAAAWTKELDKEGVVLTAEDLMCQGCQGEHEHQFGWCAKCAIRACAMERGMANCGLCADYSCEKVEEITGNDEARKARLDAIHAGLSD